MSDKITVNGFTVENVSVHMVHTRLDGWERPRRSQRLPSRYQIRTYVPGDEKIWTHIQRETEPFFAVGADLFEEQFGSQEQALFDRMFFLDHVDGSGHAISVGTATAWWQDEWTLDNQISRGEWAQVHWVAIRPQFQGKGLAKPLMDQVMQRMVRSHNRAMLGTSTGRIWAIKVYLDYGFVPDEDELSDPAVNKAWKQVHRILNHPNLAPLLA